MPRRSAYAEIIHQVASSQYGLITSAQLAEMGVPRSTVARRTRPGGMWNRVLPGVHLIQGGMPDQLQRERAALMYAGEGAMLTGVTALGHLVPRALPLRPLPEDNFVTERVHVLVPHERRRSSVAFADIERSRFVPGPDEVVRINGMVCSPVARAICDYARRMTSGTDVGALVIAGVRLGAVSAAELEDELKRAPRRGTAHLRDAIESVTAGVWSPWEGELRDLIRDMGLPEPLWNARLLGPHREFIAIPDAWFDDVALALEVDSREHHADEEGWRRTLDRQARYAAAGVLCLPLTPRQIRDEREAVMLRIRAARESAGDRPRPHVTAVPFIDRQHGFRTRTRWGG